MALLFVVFLYLHPRIPARSQAVARALPSASRGQDAVIARGPEDTGPVSSGAAVRPLPPLLVLGTGDVEPLMPRVLPDDVLVAAGPGVVSHEGQAGSFVVRTASLRGLDHGDGELGEDAGLVCADGNTLLLAVADGVGSQRGSRACAIAAVQGLRRGFRATDGLAAPQDRLQAALEGAADESARTAADLGSGACALACVLIVRGESLQVHAAAIGDSKVHLLLAGTGLRELVGAGEADGTTRALPRDVEPVVVVAEVPLDTAVLVMSDGFDEGLNHPEGFLRERVESTWQTPPPEFHVLADAAFRGDFFYDDRTVVAAWAAV